MDEKSASEICCIWNRTALTEPLSSFFYFVPQKKGLICCMEKSKRIALPSRLGYKKKLVSEFFTKNQKTLALELNIVNLVPPRKKVYVKDILHLEKNSYKKSQKKYNDTDTV